MAHPILNSREYSHRFVELRADSTAETSPEQRSDPGAANEAAATDVGSDTQSFQFGMATGLRVVTGVCILVSLTTWQRVGGAMLASMIVGSWWTHLAMRAGRRRLAYYLTAWPMGVALFAATVFLGLLAVGRFVSQPGWPWRMHALVVMCLVSVASLITVAILRGTIRETEPALRLKAAVVTMFTLVSFSVILIVPYTACILALEGPDSLATFSDAVSIFGFASITTSLVTLLASAWALPVTAPLTYGFCAILRRIDLGARKGR